MTAPESPRGNGHARDLGQTRESALLHRPPPKRRITVGLAVILAVVMFVAGLAIGYVGRGGPAAPVLVTTSQDIPAVTVTREEPTP